MQKREPVPTPYSVYTSTRISYALPHSGDVKLEVYNVNGQLVQTLVDEFEAVGTHSVPWDTEGLASGVYFYRLSAGRHAYVRKCVVLK